MKTPNMLDAKKRNQNDTFDDDYDFDDFKNNFYFN